MDAQSISGLNYLAVLALVAAFVFAMFLGPKPALWLALPAGAMAGIAWVSSSFGI